MKGLAEPQELLWGYKKLVLNRCDCSKPHAVLGLLCLCVWGSWWCRRGAGCSP